MSKSYLVRHGLMSRVGRFASDSDELERGRTVVIRSHRGTELGEVLVTVPTCTSEDAPAPGTEPRVLRVADPSDLERARRYEEDRSHRFDLCRRVLEAGEWPLELIDVEPLLDDRRTVLHYLGPHRFDATGLLSAFRASSDLDIVFEPAGRDEPVDESEDQDGGHCGSSGGGCGSEGGCGSSGGGCGSKAGGDSSSERKGGGCSDCGVKRLVASRRTPVQR